MKERLKEKEREQREKEKKGNEERKKRLVRSGDQTVINIYESWKQKSELKERQPKRKGSGCGGAGEWRNVK